MSKLGVTIRHAELEDQEKIIQFFKEHWKEDHIFVVCPELFEYYHVIGDRLTYVIAEDELTKQIYGLQGYIASNQSSTPDVWGVIWKTTPTPTPYPFLGVEIMRHIRKYTNCRIFAGCGANPKTTIPLLKFLKEQTGKLKHYYCLADLENYNIANVTHKVKPLLDSVCQYQLERFESMEELEKKFDIEKYKNRKPYKDRWYINRRYFEHPMNDYQVYGIVKEKGQIDSILVAREQRMNHSKALRILDFIGLDADVGGIGQWMQNTLVENGYEYMDCYCKGMPHKVMVQAGFTLRDEDDSNIIPNYFEPFIQKNIEVYYNTSDDQDYYVFKADADQDRPSIKRRD